jgi:pyruvate formate lyase activating enzyme
MAEGKGTIFDIKRYAIHDGPGIRTTVFMKGCPLRCPWCQNPEGISPERHLIWREKRCIGCKDCLKACQKGALSFSEDGLLVDRDLCDCCGRCAGVCPSEALELIGREVTVQEVMKTVEKDAAFYQQSGGGITISGGEPLMQPGFLSGILKACRNQGIRTALDTNGFADEQTVERIADYVDVFLWDLKMMDDEKHREATGVSNELILRNLKIVRELGKRVVTRFTLVPGVNDGRAGLMELGRFVAALGDEEEIDILPYHRTWVEKFRRLGVQGEPFDCEPPSREMLERARDRLALCGLTARIGG